MAHFAEINENNTVIRVIVTDDYEEKRGQEFISQTLGLDGKWIKTSYNTHGGIHALGGEPFRKNYAGVGYLYDEIRDAFIPQKPYESWVLNESSCLWESPIPYPADGNQYIWDEETISWVLDEISVD